MRVISWIFLLLALAALGVVGGSLLSQTESEPRELLESALRRANGPSQDRKGAVLELDQALSQAELAGDRELAADILTARGNSLRAMRAIGLATADFRRVLEEFRPDDVNVKLQLVALEEAGGDLQRALELVLEVTREHPNQTGGWALLGKVLMELSGVKLREVAALLDGELTDEDAREAMRTIRLAVGMDPSDPLRVSLLHNVRSLFAPRDQEAARTVSGLVDEISQQNAAAREALVRSFGRGVNRQAALSYLQLLRHSGRLQDAIDFGLAAVPQPTVNSLPAFMETLAEVLLEAGRPVAAAAKIQEYFDRGTIPSQAFYSIWTRALFDAQRWRELMFIARQLRSAGDEEHVAHSVFYTGYCLYQVKQFENATRFLDAFARGTQSEPHPGARALAWRALARSAQALNHVNDERGALLASVRIDPDGSGEDWFRLFEISRDLSPKALDRAEDYLTHAIRLSPERADEWMGIWREHGRRALRAKGVELALEIADLRRLGRAVPPESAGPFEIFAIAELRLQAGEYQSVIAACKRLLAAYPGFLPAVDLQAQASEAQGDFATATQLRFERLRLVGSDPETLARLRALPKDNLTNEQRLELMQLDPGDSGRSQIARTLRSEGREQAALAGLTALDLSLLGDEGFLLAAELMIAVQRYADALEMLARIDPHSPQGAHVLARALEAATELGDPQVLAEVLNSVAHVEIADPDAILAVADRLMSNGRIEEARSLLEGLDARVEQRSGTVLLHLAAVGLLQGDEVLTLDSLERAEAFAPPSETAFGHLILGVQTRQWSRLPVYARSLTGSDASLTEAQATIVAILDERIDQAELAVRERGADNAREPLWHLLSAAIDVLRGRPIQLDESIGGDNRAETLTAIYGGSTNVRDVRPMLAHLLALESSAWRVWAVADMLRVQPPESGSLWSNFLAARGFVALDQGLEAERILRRITRGWPTFAPAWDLLEQVKLARVGRTHHIGMVRLREERRAALGPRPGEEAEELLTEAWKLELGGNLEPALEKARQAVAADPDLESALVKLGELQRKLGDWTGAIESLGRAARQTEPASDSEVVAEFVGLLLGARAATPPQITAERLLRELQSQMARLGSDPLVALELARAELDGPGVSQAIGISRAYAHLDHFRESTENVAIESLRPGATQKWKDFYQSLEPERAALFLQGELRLDPGSIDLWVMYGEVLEAQGRRKEAIELYELIQSMVPSGKTLRAIASLLAHSGADPTLVQEKVDQACVLEHRDQPDVPMLVSVARALVNGNAPQINRGIGILSDIWTNRRSELTAADEIDVGQMFGTALVQRADPRDRKLAHEVLTDIAPRISDNPRRNLVTALGHLATQIPARQR